MQINISNIEEASIRFLPMIGKAVVTKQSPLSKVWHTVVLVMTENQYSNWQGGELIQNALAHLTAEEREFLMTGITPDEWNEAFGEEE
jgi:hypothetical protein